MRRLAKDLKPEKSATSSQWLRYLDQDRWILFPHSFKVRLTKSVRYPHKDLKPVLEETYGILVFQEQVMNIATTLAGFTMSEAIFCEWLSEKRKSIDGKGTKELIDGCVRNGYTKVLADKIFGFIGNLLLMVLTSSRSVLCAFSHWTAYMKANYPVEFMTHFYCRASRRCWTNERDKDGTDSRGM